MNVKNQNNGENKSIKNLKDYMYFLSYQIKLFQSRPNK